MDFKGWDLSGRDLGQPSRFQQSRSISPVVQETTPVADLVIVATDSATTVKGAQRKLQAFGRSCGGWWRFSYSTLGDECGGAGCGRRAFASIIVGLQSRFVLLWVDCLLMWVDFVLMITGLG
ncbi:hypothetical protein Ddye_018988 [Dipteronia dyeriana]|uniref:Uncharacterized protein n=1 Tax=Dipteronia dyeriana TaxID=168575 RepID=A0AAD9TXV1_9ROSI|nr:hypothetical protein Ddye_018988 [Dipteronia dyeriana]